MATAPNPPDHRTKGAHEGVDEPRIVAEHTIVGPCGEAEHEVVDQYGRRFWSFRPSPRQRYDIWGLGWVWWLIFWLTIIALIVWGWGWGY